MDCIVSVAQPSNQGRSQPQFFRRPLSRVYPAVLVAVIDVCAPALCISPMASGGHSTRSNLQMPNLKKHAHSTCEYIGAPVHVAEFEQSAPDLGHLPARETL